MANSKFKLKYLIVGYGNIGHKRKDVLGTNCLATIDPNPGTGANFRSIQEIPQNLVNRCQAVNIVVPNSEKLSLAEYWLARGKHVLVEKPLILSYQDLHRLYKTAQENKVIWYTAYNYRFEPNIVRIKKILNKGLLGKFYYARMVYGFGNVQQLIGTWRETANGVFDEVGCHLIDFAQYLLGYGPHKFEPLSFRCTEAKVWDHCLFATTDRKVLMEVSWVMWKNAFSIEIFGKKGSLHMHGLCKWGESELLVRKRVLPAGVPEETRYLEKGPPDPTWAADINYFEKMVKLGQTSYENDLKISKAFESILTQVKKK